MEYYVVLKSSTYSMVSSPRNIKQIKQDAKVYMVCYRPYKKGEKLNILLSLYIEK